MSDNADIVLWRGERHDAGLCLYRRGGDSVLVLERPFLGGPRRVGIEIARPASMTELATILNNEGRAGIVAAQGRE